MTGLARVAAVLLGLGTLTACSQPHMCTLMAAPPEISVDVADPVAVKVDKAQLSVCWNGSCQMRSFALTQNSRTVDNGCQGGAPTDVCSAHAVPAPGKSGFAEIQGLPAAPVQVSVTLLDAAGATVAEGRTNVTPHQTYPNGPDCGGGAPQASISVLADGSVRPK